MTTTNELRRNGEISVEDEIRFRTHAEVLRLFGREHKVFQKSFAKHPHEDGVHIWFPIFGYVEGNDWENSKREDWESVFERRNFDNAGYVSDLLEHPERHRRIMFAKIDGEYYFKGLYELDLELTKTAKKAAYRRVSRTATLYPVE